jgi:signal transduction histidine kinase
MTAKAPEAQATLLRSTPAALRVIRQLNASLVESLDRAGVAAVVGTQLANALSATRLVLFLAPGPRQPLQAAFAYPGQPPPSASVEIQPDDPILALCRLYPGCVRLRPEDLGTSSAWRESDRGAEASELWLISLVAAQELEGFALVEIVAPRRLGLHPWQRSLITVLATEAGLALRSSRLTSTVRTQAGELRRAQEQLQQRSQNVARLAHEIKNPLTAIRSSIQYLAEAFPGDPGRRELALGLLAELDRIQGSLRHLLSPQIAAKYQVLDLLECFDEVVSTLHPMLVERGITLSLDLEHRELPVRSTPEELRGILLNVLLNACQAMPEGGRVHTRLRTRVREPGPGETVQITLRDTGCGISPEDLPHVFEERFTTRAGGSGLGLAICRDAVARLGGQISLTSRPGAGTAVTIELPLAAGSDHHGPCADR